MMLKMLQDGVNVDGAVRGQGDVVDVDEQHAQLLIDNDMAEELPDAGDMGVEPEENQPKGRQSKGKSGSSGPLWRKKIPISQQRNLQVVVWPGQEDRGPSLCMEEGQKDDDGNWENNRIYLSTAKAFELAQRIVDGAKFIRDRSQEAGK